RGRGEEGEGLGREARLEPAAGRLLQQADELGMVRRGLERLGGLVPQRRAALAEAERRAGLAAELERDPHVLRHVAQAEARAPAARQDVLAELAPGVVAHAARPVDDVEHGARVEPEALAGEQAFA